MHHMGLVKCHESRPVYFFAFRHTAICLRKHSLFTVKLTFQDSRIWVNCVPRTHLMHDSLKRFVCCIDLNKGHNPAIRGDTKL